MTLPSFIRGFCRLNCLINDRGSSKFWCIPFKLPVWMLFLQCWACLLFLFLCKRRGITYLANPGKNPLFSSLHTYFSQHRNLVGKFCKYSTQCGRPSYWGHNIKVVITTLLVNHHYYYIIMIIALRSWFGSFYEFYCSLANKKKNTKMISSKYLATLATFLLVFLPSGSQGKCQPRWSKDKDEIGFFFSLCNHNM